MYFVAIMCTRYLFQSPGDKLAKHEAVQLRQLSKISDFSRSASFLPGRKIFSNRLYCQHYGQGGS